ncbi:MAG: hypothetical protein D6675_10510 [Gemmatimonadetes bacterium]|nr:MAG: hypothetical protein D6675_10510 [Gemmatimonadota bacterium]
MTEKETPLENHPVEAPAKSKAIPVFVTANEHYYNEAYGEALEGFEATLATENLDTETKIRAMYWKGESLAKLERYDDAIETFTTLANAYPRHNLGMSAQRRSKHLQELKEELLD